MFVMTSVQFKSLGVCSHVGAAAQINAELEGFMRWYRTKCAKVPNLMQLAKHDMPLGASRKGNRAPRKKMPRSQPTVLTDENRLLLQLESVPEVPLTQTQYNVNVDSISLQHIVH